MVLFRRLLGDVLRRHRQAQSRTLRDVATAARVSLGYLSEVERGRKEASSELLASVCEALGVSLADVLREVSDDLAVLEGRALAPVGFTASPRPASVSHPAVARPLVAATGVASIDVQAQVRSAPLGALVVTDARPPRLPWVVAA